MNQFTLNLETIDLTDEQFFKLCQNNRNLRFERNFNGELVIMSPAGGKTGHRNIEIAYQLQRWSRQNPFGIAFDSSTGFKLPNGSDRSPDASWISLEKWQNLTPEEQEKFLPLCPDFVIELRSPSDNIKTLQNKMKEYQENGTRLGWLIDPQTKTVEIYRLNQEVEILENSLTLSGEDILPQFILNLEQIW
ncbi:conserved hypothetical protein [Planktothrix sp. PCC 11201]|uniref:Uma2 family endonuclease n=1 Tax=Planktothrix sp. PCC 11201 TaxID=1729650 RepID=UPI00091AFC52|nr:Uma2 family endonuclease [Planktothrix sp. PCC 11201]SKB13530.1 conserved hypothetical protein [Planktothrix sp. PCC 11201]